MKTSIIYLLVAALANAQDLSCTISWVGNEWNGNRAWVLQDIDDLYVTPEGDIYTNIGWEEGGGNVMQFDRNGNWIGAARHTHGWGFGGGAAVTANSKYIFIAQHAENERGHLVDPATWPPKGFRWHGISRRLRSDFSKGAPFPDGKGGKGDTIKGSFKVVAQIPEETKETIRGLWANETELYVSVKNEGVVRVYDTGTMKEKRSWTVPRPDRIVMDKHGTLWILLAPEKETDGIWTLAGFDSKGIQKAYMIFDEAVIPADIAVDPRGRLLISDIGVSQQILIYDGLKEAKLELCGTTGIRNGIFAGPVSGRTGNMRFNSPKGIGTDADGNLYVANSGGTGGGSTVLESYTPDGSLRWRRHGLFFVDLADLDIHQGTASIYSKEERFSVDFSKQPGQQCKYEAYTVNPWKYPEDPRIHIWSANAWFIRTEQAPLLFVSNMGQHHIQAYRFNPATDGDTAIPAALFSRQHFKENDKGWPKNQPASGAWCWTDMNGDGAMQKEEYIPIERGDNRCAFVDDKGTLWRVFKEAACGVSLQKFSRCGAPQWNWKSPRTISCPEEIDELRRFKIDNTRDIAAFGGNTKEYKNQHWKPMGPVVAVYRDVLKGSPKKLWSAVLPYSKGSRGHESAEPMSFEIAGDYLFVCYTRGLKEENIKEAFIKVYGLKDGKFIGNIVPERVTGKLGLLDLEDALRVHQLEDGSYILFLEDDYKAKNVMIRWKP